MRRDRWTLLVLGEDGPSAKRIRVPGIVVRYGVAALYAAGLVLGLLLLAAGHQALLAREADRLADDRARLVSELDRMRERVEGIEREIARRVDDADLLRLVAGLEPLDAEVLMVGVGGPEPPSLREHPLWEVNPELGDHVFAVSYDLNVVERRARLLTESLAAAGDSVRTQHDRFRATPSLAPAMGWVSSGFGPSRLHPIHNRPMPHMGIDIAAPIGTPILAPADGRVTRAGRWSGYGLTVELDHGHGYSTLYAHASEIKVSVGDLVHRGDVIARVGQTGLATGPHLHYEVKLEGRPENPRPYFLAGAVP